MTKLILGFLVLVVGLALISSITSSVIDVTQKTGVNNETVDISAARLNSGACPMEINGTYPLLVVNVPADWRSQGGCPLTVFSMWDVWNVQATVTTDYTFFGDNGTLYLQNTTAFVWDNCSAAGVVAPNATLVAYDYCGENYMDLGWGRSVLNLVVGFFAIGLLGVSVGLFYSVARDTGLIGK